MSVKMLTFEQGQQFLGSGFDLLPYEITHIFLENDELIGVSFMEYITEASEIYIGNIDVVVEGVGYGRKIIDYLKSLENVNSITGVSGEVVLGFWEKIGAKFQDYSKTYEGYNFIIAC